MFFSVNKTKWQIHVRIGYKSPPNLPLVYISNLFLVMGKGESVYAGLVLTASRQLKKYSEEAKRTAPHNIQLMDIP